jgi:hypothetical protein
VELGVLFWNVNGNKKGKNYTPVIEGISRLTEKDKFDVIILAECKEETIRDEIEKELKKIHKNYTKGTAAGSKLAIFHKLKNNDGTLIQIFNEPRYSYFFYENTLIVGVHLLSRYPNLNGEKLYNKIKEIKIEIVDLADNYDTENIIITGDFNLDPFEHGMTEVDGFNATFSKDIAMRKPIKRTFAKRFILKHPYFYNPSWQLHGKDNKKQLGTYYKGDSEFRVHFHMLDQVIISKEFLPPVFDMDYFSIITEYNSKKGIKRDLAKENGEPDDSYSDHLPIKFKINR